MAPQKKTSFSLCPRMLYVRPIQIFTRPSTWPISLLRGSSNGEGSTKHKPYSYTKFPHYSLQHKQIKSLELGPPFTLGVRAKKTLGIFGLQIGLPNLMVPFFQPRGQCETIKFSIYLYWGQIEKFFSISALTPSVKPVGLISTFAPIRMLDLG